MLIKLLSSNTFLLFVVHVVTNISGILSTNKKKTKKKKMIIVFFNMSSGKYFMMVKHYLSVCLYICKR